MDFVMLDFVVSDLKELLVDRAKAIGVLSDLVRDIEGAAWGAIAPVQEELIPFFLESRAMQYRAWKSSVSKDLDNRENEILARLGEFQTESAKVRKGN